MDLCAGYVGECRQGQLEQATCLSRRQFTYVHYGRQLPQRRHDLLVNCGGQRCRHRCVLLWRHVPRPKRHCRRLAICRQLLQLDGHLATLRRCRSTSQLRHRCIVQSRAACTRSRFHNHRSTTHLLRPKRWHADPATELCPHRRSHRSCLHQHVPDSPLLPSRTGLDLHWCRTTRYLPYRPSDPSKRCLGRSPFRSYSRA